MVSTVTVDALLIDEAQDFDDPWLGFVVETVRPGRGGIALAGDDRQALYRDASRPWALAGRRVARLQLQRVIPQYPADPRGGWHRATRTARSAAGGSAGRGASRPDMGVRRWDEQAGGRRVGNRPPNRTR